MTTRTIRCPKCGADAEQTYVELSFDGYRVEQIPGVIICPNAISHQVGQVAGDHLRLTDG